MTSLRLVADDLTGALDTAAEFVGLAGPIQVYWADAVPSKLPLSAALDSGTRERGRSDAVAVVGDLASALAEGAIAYKKVDSLLRGHAMAELAACFRLGVWRHAVLAPAFPYQGRATRGGRQFAKGLDGHWSPVTGDLVAELAAEGIAVERGRHGAELPAGISVFDAETDDDLDRIVAVGRRAAGRVLWCGSGGLARALAAGTDATATRVLQPPVLGLFGSDQAATAAQLAACGPCWVRLADGGADSTALVGERLRGRGAVLASFDLPPGLSRAEAAERIRRALEELTRSLAPPRTLIVAGGETLRAVCAALRADSLEVRGRIVPGLPRSVLRGGRWDGIEVVSKSGAFGGRNLLRGLLDEIQIEAERTQA